MYKMFT